MKKKPGTIICCLLLLLVTIGCSVCFCACQPQPYNAPATLNDMYGTYDHTPLFPTTYREFAERPDVTITFRPPLSRDDPFKTVSNAYRVTQNGYYRLCRSVDGPYYIPQYVPYKTPTEVILDINKVLPQLSGPVTISPGKAHFVNSDMEYTFDADKIVTLPGCIEVIQLYYTNDDRYIIELALMLFPIAEDNPQKKCFIVYQKQYKPSRYDQTAPSGVLLITLLKEFTDNDQQ